MRAEAVLTPDESKHLIAKALIQMDSMQRSLKTGLIVIHPSSTTLFIMKELGFEPSKLWSFGVVRGDRLCISKDRQKQLAEPTTLKGPENFRYAWVLDRGEWSKEMRLLGQLLSEMKEGDVYIKSGNALDPQGNVGVLHASPSGGTVGLASRKARQQGFEILLPMGLEKLIPTSIMEAAKLASREVDWAMGQPCGLFPVSGTVVTEVHAINILTGAKATPIAAGGLEEGYGAVVLSIEGETNAVKKAINLINDVKGSKSPNPGEASCTGCMRETCHFSNNH